ncbi:sigma-70 family RNA polymerase sigma factor [Streptomyces collinus]|uniref:sigma-70 family RNA polymerase sigma factor n=1 Tax=Streptomyces collinus TaxID=42684 RepID=UPI0033C32824
MSGIDKTGGKVPRQRGLARGAVLPEELNPEAQRQWGQFLKMRPSVRRQARWIIGHTGQSVHLDDIESKVSLALYTRLKSGPLDGKLSSYLWTITRRESYAHLKELARRAETFVGDDTSLLEDPKAHVSINLAGAVELAQAMHVLRTELSGFQLKVFVLAEAYGLEAPAIATVLGNTTKDSVRDALRHARRKLRSERVGLQLGVFADE